MVSGCRGYCWTLACTMSPSPLQCQPQTSRSQRCIPLSEGFLWLLETSLCSHVTRGQEHHPPAEAPLADGRINGPASPLLGEPL